MACITELLLFAIFGLHQKLEVGREKQVYFSLYEPNRILKANNIF